jgi:hypothetical protein
MRLPPFAWGGRVCAETAVAEVLCAAKPVIANAEFLERHCTARIGFSGSPSTRPSGHRQVTLRASLSSWFAFVTKLATRLLSAALVNTRGATSN